MVPTIIVLITPCTPLPLCDRLVAVVEPGDAGDEQLRQRVHA